MTRTLISAALASAAMLTVAQAQTIGTATTDLNLRSGPDPQFPVIGMIRENRSAIVLGCIEGSRWCQVDVRGQTGWAYSQYMTLSGDLVAVLPAPELEVNVASRPVIAAPPPLAAYPAPGPVVTYQAPPPVYAPAPVATYRAPATSVVETTGIAPRDFAGAFIAPRETVYASTTPPPAYMPPRSVRSYLTANPIDPVYLEGNLQIGAGLPDNVDLWPVPNSRYNYTYVNDYPVLVEPTTRRIVYVSR